MYDAYQELLAYQDLDDAVDKVYRAYLDAMLIRYAAQDGASYTSQAAALRAAELNDKPEFIYWFDVRTDFWSTRAHAATTLDELGLSERFDHLQREALVLRDRFRLLGTEAAAAPPVAGPSRSSYTTAGERSAHADNRLERVLKSLLAGPPAEEEPRRRGARGKRAGS